MRPFPAGSRCQPRAVTVYGAVWLRNIEPTFLVGAVNVVLEGVLPLSPGMRCLQISVPPDK
jgi:hypothetical protein